MITTYVTAFFTTNEVEKWQNYGVSFDGQNESWIHAFGASISFDQKMAAHKSIKGSLAHVSMLAHTGIITAAEADKISAGLNSLQEKLAQGNLEFTIENEDIHMNLETYLAAEVGPVRRKAPYRPQS